MVMLTEELEIKLADLVEEIEPTQLRLGLTDEQVYKIATDDTRQEYFVRMYALLKEINNG